MGAFKGKTFKSGNSVAVRLPKDVAFAADTQVTIERRGDAIIIRPAHDPAEAKRQLREMIAAMRAIGPPGDGVQPRDPFEDPERPGL